MSALFIRIIGGVFGGTIGTYLSGYIYDYFNKNRQPIPQIKPPEIYKPKYQDAKSFEEILNIQIEEKNTKVEDEIFDDKYDDNISEPKIKNINSSFKLEDVNFMNDALYDNSYEDFYQIYIDLVKSDNK